MISDERRQVMAQCKAVAHLATIIAGIHGDYEKMFADEQLSGPDKIVDRVGERTAHLMETLGDILNGMDAATEEDAWLDPIFEEAHRRWPVKVKSA